MRGTAAPLKQRFVKQPQLQKKECVAERLRAAADAFKVWSARHVLSSSHVGPVDYPLRQMVKIPLVAIGVELQTLLIGATFNPVKPAEMYVVDVILRKPHAQTKMRTE